MTPTSTGANGPRANGSRPPGPRPTALRRGLLRAAGPGGRRPDPAAVLALLARLGVVAAVTESGYVHAKLYVDGYRFVHDVGVMFLLQASVSFAVAALLLVSASPLLQAAAAGTAAGALSGFAMSRTVGVAGFKERGFQPSPDALLSVLAESATLVLVAALAARTFVRWRRGRRRDGRWDARQATVEG